MAVDGWVCMGKGNCRIGCTVDCSTMMIEAGGLSSFQTGKMQRACTFRNGRCSDTAFQDAVSTSEARIFAAIGQKNQRGRWEIY